MGALRWRVALERALYGGPGDGLGFYLRDEGRPAGHFRTSVHVSPLFAGAVARLLVRTAHELGTDEVDFVDMGAGGGELAAGVLAAVPRDLTVRAHAVERAARPPGLDARVAWCAETPPGARGLLFANEWLDNVPLDIAEWDGAGVARYVLVRPDGTEEPGGPVEGLDLAWLRRWWPGAEPGTRAEIGRSRDEAWAAAAGSLGRGLAVAADYGHTRDARPRGGTLAAYRDGRQVRPVPDGTRDLTVHVAMDACARPGSLLTTQREALRELGVSGARPPLALAGTDPAGYLRDLARAGEAAELTARGGLGDFLWLLQPVGIGGPLIGAAETRSA